MKLTAAVNGTLQALATALQLYNQYGGLIPMKYKWIATGALGITQGVVALLSHWRKPDGTALPPK